MMKQHSPSDHLNQHPLTVEMLRLGVTPAQLEAIDFRANNKGWPFDQWSFRFPIGVPRDAIGLIKAYCALKWIVLQDPPATPERSDAWDLIQCTLTGANLAAARAARRANSKLGVAIRKKYLDADHARWKVLATEPDIARIASKRRRAELIAQRVGLKRSAAEAIRKVI